MQRAQGIREVAFVSRRAAEEYLSSMASCISDVTFTGDPQSFAVSYAGGSLGQCALHHARVSSLSWSIAESEDVHLVVLQRGSLTVRRPGGRHESIGERTAMILPPASRGRVEVAPETTGVSLIVPRATVLDQARRILGREPSDRLGSITFESRPLGEPVVDALARNCGAAIREMLALGQTGLSELARSHLDELLLSLLAAAVVEEVRDDLGTVRTVSGSGIVHRAQEYIRAHAADPIRLADLADSLGVGMRALQIAFRKQIGTTPREFLMGCRLELARSRLVGGDASTRISTVAFDCGFTDLALFSRKYRQTYGELPSATLRRR